MTSDNERREVARRLRGNPEDTLIPHRTGRHHGMGCREAADRFWDMCERIKSAGDYDIAHSTRSVLADLIEPGEPGEPKVKCVAEVKIDGERLEQPVHDAAVELTGIDCDALLALANEMDRDGKIQRGRQKAGERWFIDGLDVREYARRIREALGVEDGR